MYWAGQRLQAMRIPAHAVLCQLATPAQQGEWVREVTLHNSASTLKGAASQQHEASAAHARTLGPSRCVPT